ncbi:MAG: lytic transglycosylase domain-containing protein, partial [Mycetocola sp.]
IGTDGVTRPSIIGVALDGSQTRTIRDTDGGRLDGDTEWDRAVGPMQFIPQSWEDFGEDGSGDGVADPQNIDDASLSAAHYLCEAGGDLSQVSNWITAVAAYNDASDYNANVVAAADHYATQAGN